MPITETIETGYVHEGKPLRIRVTMFEVRCFECGVEFLSLVKDDNALLGKQLCSDCNDRAALREFWEPYTE